FMGGGNRWQAARLTVSVTRRAGRFFAAAGRAGSQHQGYVAERRMYPVDLPVLGPGRGSVRRISIRRIEACEWLSRRLLCSRRPSGHRVVSREHKLHDSGKERILVLL